MHCIFIRHHVDGTQNWCDLGPLSVMPAFQRKGIGKSLMFEGLSSLRALGAKACALVGGLKYYQRFGFSNHPQLILEGMPHEYIMVLPFDECVPQSAVAFHPGFAARAQAVPLASDTPLSSK